MIYVLYLDDLCVIPGWSMCYTWMIYVLYLDDMSVVSSCTIVDGPRIYNL